MVQRKNDEFSNEDIYLSEIAKALSHPARIKILQLLSSLDTCICGEIVSQMPLAQATVSQHLKELKRIGFIKGEIDGPKTCYCLNKEKIGEAGIQFQLFFNDLLKGEN